MSNIIMETNWISYPTRSKQYLPSSSKVLEEKVEKSRTRSLLFSFLDETTIHGLRYFSNKHKSKIYVRLIWLVIFLVCAGVMLFQISDRIRYYIEWPVTVDVRINYIHSLSFPALTICNQNAFKTTATSRNGQYNLLEDIFSGNTTLLRKYPEWENTTLQQLNLDNGHRKEDLIIQCKWAGEKCDASWFSTTITDHGLCYTFNGHQQKQPVKSLASGAKSGLKLLLNIEQYDYMPGPHDAGGVKILLHEPNEFPFIDELGKALQVGTHTFVGVQMFNLHNLPKPHGNCGEKKLAFLDNYTHTLAACRADCRAQMLFDQCGCLDFYYPRMKGYRSCAIKDIPCIFPAKNSIRKISDKNCHCPVSCDSRHFGSEISFGSMSQLGLQKLQKKVDISDIQSRFINAREQSQRNWKHVVKEFADIVNQLQHRLDIYNATLNTVLRHAITNSYNNIKNMYAYTKEHWKKKRYYYRYQDYVVRKNTLRGRDAYEERYFRFVAENPYGFSAYVKEIYVSLFSFFQSNLQQCLQDKSVLPLKAAIVARLDVARKSFDFMENLIQSFKDGYPIFEYKFGQYDRETGRSIIPKALMKNALTRTWNARNYGLKTSQSIAELIVDLEQLLNNTENICNGSVGKINNITSDLIDHSKTFYHNKANLYTETVDWMYQELERRIAKFENLWQLFESDFKTMEVHFISYLSSLQDVTDKLKKIQFSVSLAEKYLTNNLTKLDIFEIFTSSEMSVIENKIETLKTESFTRSVNNRDQLKTMSQTVQYIWKIITNDENMQEFYQYTNKTEYLVNIESLISGIKTNFTRYENESNFYSLLNGTDDQFLEAYKRMVEHLVQYANSLDIKDDFYMKNFVKMEIFYRELSYEDVRQQPAYDMFALLCDIGGSMGLFVGASVISIFEIVDLICHVVLTKKKDINGLARIYKTKFIRH